MPAVLSAEEAPTGSSAADHCAGVTEDTADAGAKRGGNVTWAAPGARRPSAMLEAGEIGRHAAPTNWR